ncbi:MAG: ATP-binding protein [Planctomycetota bacterium]
MLFFGVAMDTQTARHRLLIPAQAAKLSDLREAISQIFEGYSLSPKLTRRMVLALDECVANIIEHGRVPETDGAIEIAIDVLDDRIVAEISDNGVPFDPSLRGEQRGSGSYPRRGFGLYLIHMIADSIEYERTPDGRNVLTLTKMLNSTSQPESAGPDTCQA